MCRAANSPQSRHCHRRLRSPQIADDLPDRCASQILSGGFSGSIPAAAERVAAFTFLPAAEALAEWFGRVAALRLAADPDACRAAIDRDIAALDALIGAQLDAILHQPRLRRFEGSWRGLAWLVGGLDPAGRVKMRLLNIAWPELCRDLERAVEFDQSQLFRKVYEERIRYARRRAVRAARRRP